MLVGAGTVRSDDPALTVRHVDGRDPLRVVLGRAPSEARIRPCLELSGDLGEVLVGPRHRVYFSGDTGLFPGMKTIGERLGPFDLTMIEVGQYDRAWPDWHIGPEQAVLAHQLVRGKVFLPIHWGLYALAYHGWTEPAERARAEAVARNEARSMPFA